MKRFVAVGECMIELSEAETPGLWRQGVAGDTLNTAWYARASLPETWQVDYMTRIGGDPFSDAILAFLDTAGLGTRHVLRDAKRGAGLYAISLSDGERSFTYWRGESAARGLADDPQALTQAFDGAELVFLSGISVAILPIAGREALLAAVIAAKATGAIVAFDPNIRLKLWENQTVARSWLMRFASVASVLLPSFEDDAGIFGDRTPSDTLARYNDAGVAEIVVKDGGQDIVWRSGIEKGIMHSANVMQPVDTTGAGDSFNGAYLAARMGGADMAAAVSAGHAMAKRVIMHKGALLPSHFMAGPRLQSQMPTSPFSTHFVGKPSVK